MVNASLRPKRRLDIDFYILFDADVEKVKKIVGAILKESEIVQEKSAPRVIIDKFSPGYMEMKARFWVDKKYALVGRRGFNEKIKARFDEEGIKMAPPRIEIDEMPDHGDVAV